MLGTNWLRITIIVVQSLLMLLFGNLTQAQIRLDLPAQALGSSLTAVGTQGHLNLMFDPAVVDGLKAPALKAALSADDALSRLLKGTKLHAVRVDANTVRITIEASPKSAPASAVSDFGTTNAWTGVNLVGNAALADHGDIPDSENSSLPSGEPVSNPIALDEVLITGTHIHGVTPASPVITVDQTEIQASGFVTTGDVIRSLPQTFAGGVNPGVNGAFGASNEANVSSASTVNLRGIGSESTLTLIDGHRMAYDGFSSSADISMIPANALQRVEIVADGASAIYGSDAVAGVANFITRKDYEGAEVSAHSGSATEGGGTEQQYNLLIGKSRTAGNVLFDYDYYRENEVRGDQRSYSSGLEEPAALLPAQERHSGLVSGNLSLSEKITLSVDGLYTYRTSELRSTFSGITYVTPTNVNQYGMTVGLDVKLAGAWTAKVSATKAASKDDQRIDLFSGATVLGSFQTSYQNRMSAADMSADGPVLTLPTGTASAALGGGYRNEAYADPTESGTRSTRYTFAELYVPLVVQSVSRLGLEKLELSIAGRRESYSDFGSATNPKLGLVYVPLNDISLRSTWGKSFRAPSLIQEYGQRLVQLYPGSLFGRLGPVLETGGSNRSLAPETASTWTVGADFVPQSIPKAKLSLTYFSIAYRNRITFPVIEPSAAFTSPVYAPFVVENPPLALLDKIARNADIFENNTGGAYDPTQVAGVVENEYQNAARQRITGFDALISDQLEGHYGAFAFSANGSYLSLHQYLTALSPRQTLSGTIFNPPRFRFRGGAVWSHTGLSLGAYLNYVTGETDTLNGAPIGSWTTIDAQLAFCQTNSRVGPFDKWRIALTAFNLLNREPPRVAADSTLSVGLGYDSTNASPLGRFVGMTISTSY